MTYQKDGPGNLRRLYLDRIFSPPRFAGLERRKLGGVPKLVCPNCKEVLGEPATYVKEKRKAFRLYQDSVTKQLRSKQR